MLRLVSWITVVAILTVLAACSGNSPVPPAGGGETQLQNPMGLDLPSPRDLPGHESAAIISEELGGWFNIDPYPSHRISGSGTDCLFYGDWDPDNPTPRDPAYVTYDIPLGEVEPFSLELEWEGAAPAVWAALGNYGTNEWEWYEAGGPVLLPPGLDGYLDPYDQLLVLIVVTDFGEFRLKRLWLGDGEGTVLTDLFFLHHSTGEGIIDGGVREYISDYNDANGTEFEFWDHGYNEDGLFDAEGVSVGRYDIPGDNTDPDGLHYLWCSDDVEAQGCRTEIITNHKVIAFKSCYPASNIEDADQLQQYKDWYIEMLSYFHARQDCVFVVMSTPPLHPEHTNADNAARARQFANWLKSGEYLDGQPNVVCFDLFDALAQPDGVGAEANMLRADYRQAGEANSHPNQLANETVAPVFAQFLIDAGLAH